MATRIYKTPFAATGDKEALATADQPDGKVSLQAGWTPDYELPNDNANYRPVGRAEMNGVFNELTLALGEMQLNGFAKWQAIDGGWPLNGQVLHNGMAYRSTTAANVTEPGTAGATWVPMGSGIASTAQAQAMIDDSVLLTPKKLADAFLKRSFTQDSWYLVYPGGLIAQGGYVKDFSNYTITLPTAFPNGVLGQPIACAIGTEAAAPASAAFPETSVVIGSQFKIFTYTPPSAAGGPWGTGPRAVAWLAFGY